MEGDSVFWRGEAPTSPDLLLMMFEKRGTIPGRSIAYVRSTDIEEPWDSTVLIRVRGTLTLPNALRAPSVHDRNDEDYQRQWARSHAEFHPDRAGLSIESKNPRSNLSQTLRRHFDSRRTGHRI